MYVLYEVYTGRYREVAICMYYMKYIQVDIER